MMLNKLLLLMALTILGVAAGQATAVLAAPSQADECDCCNSRSWADVDALGWVDLNCGNGPCNDCPGIPKSCGIDAGRIGQKNLAWCECFIDIDTTEVEQGGDENPINLECCMTVVTWNGDFDDVDEFTQYFLWCNTTAVCDLTNPPRECKQDPNPIPAQGPFTVKCLCKT